MIPVGFTLQPDVEFLERCGRLIAEEPDYYEVAPETLWRQDARGRLEPNGFHRYFRSLGARSRRFFVAHGVGLSMGTASPADRARRARWLRRVKADHALFRFRWYSDHLGATSVDGLAMTLPLPLPMDARTARIVRGRLEAMRRVVPRVGVENNVAYFVLGEPLEEPAFYAACTAGPGAHLVLDVHNLYTMAENLGFDARAYAARLPLERVIEIHLSGGTPSEAAWLQSGRVLRLDSHDRAVPEAVWALFEELAPRCPSLRGVTLERMEGTVGDDDVPVLVEELRRARRTLARAPRTAPPARASRRVPPSLPRGAAGWEGVLAELMAAADPGKTLRRLQRDRGVDAALRRRLALVDVDGLGMSALLVARLRFERLLRGSTAAESWFDAEPAAFAAAFKRYHAAVPPSAFFPAGEARLFDAWRSRH